ncbi:MAG TPA: hypothetical protein VMF09_10960 [Solirubrobacteraceae bacterium]|nr:hypothetical protein [Solirubrobacteraceae bacterium]
MTDFLNALKADLLDRRLLPLVAVVVLGLAGAVAYVVVGGGSAGSTPTSAAAGTSGAASPGIAISQASPETAVAETTGGSSLQHGGSSRDPFVALAEPKAKSASAKTSTSPSSSSSSSAKTEPGNSSSSGSSAAGSSTPTPGPTPSKSSKPAKPASVYHVAVLFGLLAPAGSAQSAQLTPFENLKLLTPLPSASQPLVVFRGVTAGGASATFSLVSEAILHGEGACLPSPAQCEAIGLKSGQSEQLEYVSASNQNETYELKVVSIVSSKASSAAVKGLMRETSKAGEKLLSEAGLTALPGLRYSAQAGVLVSAK